MSARWTDLVGDRVRADPAATAVVAGDQVLSYQDLYEQARRVAGWLADQAVAPDGVVAIAVPRGADLVVGVLGISLAGVAWLPVDPAYPRERRDFMVTDAGAQVLLGQTELATATRHPRPVDPRPADPVDPRPADPRAGQLAYVIYTSGSTGRPKGVAVPHTGLTNLVLDQAERLAIGAGDRVLQFASTSFDASVFEIATSLAAGATLVVAGEPARRSGSRLAALLAEARITHALLPPSMLAAMPDDPLPELRVLISGGEELAGAVAARWRAGRRLVNAYGPTEATVITTEAEVSSTTEAGDGPPPIGAPIGGARIMVAGPDLAPVPRGDRGELLIGGAGLAWGYRGRPALTAERFVPAAGGGRWYRTGDLVSQRPDGQLAFHGRVDDQLKIRGFRIEPGEVAAVLREHPAVRDAAVVPDPDRQALLAYAVGGADPARLRHYLADRLPAHLLPAAVTVLDALPLTPAGKLDRAALPAPDRTASGLAATPAAPATPLERELAELFGELLGVPEVGAGDDFLALGGHSLLATRLAARIKQRYEVDPPLPELMRAITVRRLAALISAGPPVAPPPAPPAPPVTPVDRRGALPLSFPQERVWFLEQLATGNLAYHAQMTIRLLGPLDPEALRATLTEIVRRHEIFRTSFVPVDGTGVQLVRPPMPIALPVLTVPEAGVDRLVRRLARQPFDLARPPLARWLLVRHGPADHTLVQVEHHFVHDGWSFARLLAEIEAIYPAMAAHPAMTAGLAMTAGPAEAAGHVASAGPAPPLPEPVLQYGDFAVWQRRWLRGEALEAQLSYWQRRLAGAPAALDLPTDHRRPPRQSFVGDALRVPVPPALAGRLRGFARGERVSLFATMLAGFAALLQRYTGATDLVVGTGVANRRLAELEPVIGMMVNTLPLRLDTGGRPGLAGLARRVHDEVAEAAAWQDLPLERLVERLGVPRDPSRNPLFQVMFSFHDSPVPDLEFAGLRGTVTERHNGSAKADLNVVVVPRGEQRTGRAARADDGELTLIWEYPTALFERSTMEQMVRCYLALLAAGTAEPDRPVAGLRLLPQAETEPVVRGFNRTGRSYPDRVTIPERFAEQVRRRPDKVAVIAGRQRLTYAELATRAESLAGALRAAGVCRDQPVGVLLERGLDLVVAVLAVLKAGGGYLPLDPSYPDQRLAWQLDDCGAGVVVTRTGLAPRAAGRTAICVDQPVADTAPAAGRHARPHPRGLAYIVYTSGSTGRPKGVMVDHRAVLRLVCGQDYLDFGPHQRIAQLATMSFDASTFELWGALLHGGTVCVIDQRTALDPAAFAAELRRLRVSAMFLTTALFDEIVARRPDAFAPVGTVLFGGEAADPERVRRLLTSAHAPRRLVHVYGPTEATTFATAGTVTAVPDGASGVPIGSPIANTTAYVLDQSMAPVPPGLPGELHLGGPGLARGYLGGPGLTADRFRPDPFGVAGGRLYATGDRVRWRPDGQLEFLGRIDDQVKIRGFRVEPGEVRAVLLGHPMVTGAAVVVTGSGGDQRLVAYAVTQLPGSALRAWLAERLPPYLVPASVVPVAALPLTAAGKLDRAALPAPEPDRAAGQVAPRDGTEAAVAAICAELLDVDRIGIDEDFFAAGGHSLLASRLVARVNDRFGVRVRLAEFLAAPRVAGLAAAVAAAEQAPVEPPLRRYEVTGGLGAAEELVEVEP